jgi:hypothetical protein
LTCATSDELRATGSTRLGDQVMPPLSEIDAEDEFSATAVSAHP